MHVIVIHSGKPALCSFPHCKGKIPKFRNKYSQKRNIGVSVPISTFMRLWVIYIFPRSVCLFCCRKYVDRSSDYINRSQTNECGNWDWGRAIPRKGIHKWDFRCSALCFAGALVHFAYLLVWQSCYNCQTFWLSHQCKQMCRGFSYTHDK